MKHGTVLKLGEVINMSTSITIPTELQEKLAKRAAEQGKDAEEFALEVLSRAVEAPSLRQLFADVREQIRTRDATDEGLDARIETAVKEIRKRRA
jgi:predicted DNA-binding protein